MATLKWVLSSAYNIIMGSPAAGNSKLKFPDQINNGANSKSSCISEFRMPLHYPRYNKSDYENMEDCKLQALFNEYGLNFNGSNLQEMRKFAMGAFLWPHQM